MFHMAGIGRIGFFGRDDKGQDHPFGGRGGADGSGCGGYGTDGFSAGGGYSFGRSRSTKGLDPTTDFATLLILSQNRSL